MAVRLVAIVAVSLVASVAAKPRRIVTNRAISLQQKFSTEHDATHPQFSSAKRTGGSVINGTKQAKDVHMIGGVPVYNYAAGKDMVSVYGAGNANQDWILVMKQTTSSQQVHAVCSQEKTCISEGHPSDGGIAFATVQASQQDLQSIVDHHKDVLEFIEPSLPVYIPEYKGNVASSFSEISQEDSQIIDASTFSEISEEDSQIIKRSGDNSGYWVLGKGGVGPCTRTRFRGPVALSEADALMEEFLKSTSHTKGCEFAMVTPLHEFKVVKYRTHLGPIPGRIIKVFKEWWTSATSSTGLPTNSWGLDRIDERSSGSGDKMDGHFGTGSGLDGEGIHIYVLDTGIRTTHVDFGGRAIPTIDVTSGKVKKCKGRGDTKCAADRNGHGTHCSGTAGGQEWGVAKKSTLHAVKVLNDDGGGKTSQIVMAIDWVSANAQKPAVMSMSLGSDVVSETIKSAIERAEAAGILSVVAAGNCRQNQKCEGPAADACLQSPAYVPSAITVANVGRYGVRALNSKRGTCVDIFAPGEWIRSAWFKSDIETKQLSGTSMATPHVAGAAALLLQAHKEMTPAELTAALLGHATKGIMDLVLNPWEGDPNLREKDNESPNLLLYARDLATVPAPVQRRRRSKRVAKPVPVRRRRRSQRRRKSQRRRRSPVRRRRRRRSSSSRRRRRRKRRTTVS